jgi:acetyl-CoA acetyltransferase
MKHVITTVTTMKGVKKHTNVNWSRPAVIATKKNLMYRNIIGSCYTSLYSNKKNVTRQATDEASIQRKGTTLESFCESILALANARKVRAVTRSIEV